MSPAPGVAELVRRHAVVYGASVSARVEQRTVLMVGNYLPSLAVARALSGAGFRVIGGDPDNYPPLASSRHCHETWVHPPIAEKVRFLDALNAYLVRRRDVTIVLPLQEDYVAAFAEDRRPLPDGVVLAMAKSETVSTCLDKPAMYDVAARAQVPFLPVAMVADCGTLEAASERIGYPVIIRPTGRVRYPDQGGLAVICSRADEVMHLGNRWRETTDDLFVQRYVKAPRHNVYFAARAGRILARSESRILQTTRADGTGPNVQAITVKPDPRLRQWTDALVCQLDYTGVGLAQYLVPAGQDAYFMELNPRLGAGVALPQGIGLDLAVAACELAAAESVWRPDPKASERIGQRYVWTSGSIHGLLKEFGRGELTYGQALRWLARTTVAALRADIHAIWSLRDPKPTLVSFMNWLSRDTRG